MGILDKLTGKKESQPSTVPSKALLGKGEAQPSQPIQPMQGPRPPEGQPQAPPGMPPSPMPEGQPTMPEPPREPSPAQAAAAKPSPKPPETLPSQGPEPPEKERRVRVVEEEKSFTSAPESAPVFVKLSRYEDLLEELATMKANSVNIKALLDVLSKVRELEGITLDELERHVDEMENAGEEIDTILVKEEPLKKKVQESKFKKRRAEKNEEVESLERRVRRLKEEIQSMSR